MNNLPPVFSREQRMDRCNRLNTVHELSADGLRIFVENTSETAIARGLKKLGGLKPEDWRAFWLARIGNEPVARLYFVIARDILQTKVMTLAEVLCEDPPLMVECMKTMDVKPYYSKYPASG
jgi:hypothetical protein